jgi:hypothetical protein
MSSWQPGDPCRLVDLHNGRVLPAVVKDVTATYARVDAGGKLYRVPLDRDGSSSFLQAPK